jgi:hypothetical protein
MQKAAEMPPFFGRKRFKNLSLNSDGGMANKVGGGTEIVGRCRRGKDRLFGGTGQRSRRRTEEEETERETSAGDNTGAASKHFFLLDSVEEKKIVGELTFSNTERPVDTETSHKRIIRPFSERF